ncbi:MAG: cob(I)yrinic acid a,c-diamide adenosyltransferase [Prevotella sp.]|nr:cob(I)yrinic acid a,c-diamide adenosyltransferase [Prevotella sp.]
MKITKVYTRTGDRGTTSLVGGVRTSKSDMRLEAYGTVDELNAHIGLLLSQMPECEECQLLERVQSDLFNVGTHLATDQSQTPLYASARLSAAEVKMLEEAIDRLLAELPEQSGFVLPSGTVAASQAHVCRTVCRRAERRIAALAEHAAVGAEIQQFINRLSDYFFILAKKINFIEGRAEKIWKNACE